MDERGQSRTYRSGPAPPGAATSLAIGERYDIVTGGDVRNAPPRPAWSVA
jgi:hypothetical protein